MVCDAIKWGRYGNEVAYLGVTDPNALGPYRKKEEKKLDETSRVGDEYYSGTMVFGKKHGMICVSSSKCCILMTNIDLLPVVPDV